ncbi:MAG: DNA adenine methylase, partial [Lutibacter sp.]
MSTKLLNEIYNTIGDFNTFYDLFGGGGSMSITASLSGHKTVYNELNKGVYNLFKHVLTGGEIPKHWITREEFHKYKTGDDWFSGLVKCCWSFGNNQSSYLFGAENEKLKRLAHEIVINNCEKSRIELSKLIGVEIPDRIDRLWFCRNYKTKRFKLEQLERLEKLEKLQRLEQ